MNRKEALEVLKTIAELYPRFELTERKAAILIPGLLKMDYKKVMKNLEKHVTEYAYPPTLAEIAAYPSEKNEALERIEKYEREARENPPTPEQRRMYAESMKRLFKEGEDR